MTLEELQKRLDAVLHLGAVAEKTWQEERADLLARLDAQQQESEAQLGLAMAMHHAASGELIPPKNAPSFVHQVADLRAERDELQQRLNAVTAREQNWRREAAMPNLNYGADYNIAARRVFLQCADELAAVLTGAQETPK